MKKAYAVCCRTTIDADTPGYFIITTCTTLDNAKKVENKLNALTLSELMLLGDITLNRYTFGCNKIVGRTSIFFITPISIVEDCEIDSHISYLKDVCKRKEARDKKIADIKERKLKEIMQTNENEKRIKEERDKKAQRILDNAKDYYKHELEFWRDDV
jgi:hypothetical protein